jgi:hypothetical protein
MGPSTKQFFSSSDVIATTIANSYCSQANRLRQCSTICRLMMIEWSKHVVALTSEEEKKNCRVRRTHNCFDNSSRLNMALVLTRPLTETGRQRVRLTTLSSVIRLSRKCMNFDVSQRHEPPRSVTGIAYFIFYLVIWRYISFYFLSFTPLLTSLDFTFTFIFLSSYVIQCHFIHVHPILHFLSNLQPTKREHGQFKTRTI